jgi:hypothetical protein
LISSSQYGVAPTVAALTAAVCGVETGAVLFDVDDVLREDDELLTGPEWITAAATDELVMEDTTEETRETRTAGLATAVLARPRTDTTLMSRMLIGVGDISISLDE